MATHLHVVLAEDIPNLGKSGELVKVRPGFARNFLVPRGLAVSATQKNVARIEHEKKVAEVRAGKLKSEAQTLAEKLGSVKLTLLRPVGDGDRLYGSVTSRDIELALADQGYRVDRRRMVFEPIKVLGTTSVSIRLATDVSATIQVTVAAK
jgi:large subunit ribosomal protein L9